MLEGIEFSTSKVAEARVQSGEGRGSKVDFQKRQYGEVCAARCCLALPFQCAELSLHDLPLC